MGPQSSAGALAPVPGVVSAAPLVVTWLIFEIHDELLFEVPRGRPVAAALPACDIAARRPIVLGLCT